jgi:hypothetical protein
VKTESYILSRIEAIEAEIADLKKRLNSKPKRNVKSLEGILSGIDVTDGDLEEAKGAWQKAVDDF